MVYVAVMYHWSVVIIVVVSVNCFIVPDIITPLKSYLLFLSSYVEPFILVDFLKVCGSASGKSIYSWNRHFSVLFI